MMYALAGYNDFEYAVADFAIAVAGMVSVGIHGTYTAKEAVGAINTVGCHALLFMQDMAWHSQRQAMGRWAVQDVRIGCPSVHTCVVMDSESVRITF
jgi:long-subunit acyl-CoA synthetase (AMP-forming)